MNMDKFKNLMKLHRVSQIELSRRSKITPANVSAILKGNRNVTWKTVQVMATSLGYRAEIEYYPVEASSNRIRLKNLKRWDEIAAEIIDSGAVSIDDAPMSDYEDAKQWRISMIEQMADERLENELEDALG